ncbi:type II toxin-antitoxin system RelE/ParE family toxin [Rhizobium wuzhouense]|uniref:Type II toxin-antitoxin system RelE/ParE family toxin n=1 Tax=Rhizobium wuzhouense TaxID=1986026 RepID=A0ABX5NQG6_9HYPH|nr:type II toxin-antitoxin system RelE/ParE family toxin [Rhizobium wuzhouense]PYB73040.1 type II toxin-antitoxin system RelE/ParE family toxin [Rhizobium wuzhouense]
MRRAKVRFRPEALTDLRDIFAFVLSLSQSPVTARRYVGRIRARCEKIGDIPHGGVSREDLAPGLRMVPFEHSAIVLYVVENGGVEITNIFYGRRNYAVLFNSSG